MTAPLLCLGDRTYYYPFNNRLKGARGIVAASKRSLDIYTSLPPPYVLSTLSNDIITNVEVLSIVDKFNFDSDGNVISIPWSYIFRWLNIGTEDQGKLFLQDLSLGTKKKKLQSKPLVQKKNRIPLSRLLQTSSSFACSCPRHRFLCDTPVHILAKDIDQDYYHQFHTVVCRRCAINQREWSADGFFRSSHARRALRALDRLPEYSHLIDALMLVVNTTKGLINFYRYAPFEIIQTQVASELETSIKSLYIGKVALSRVLIGKWQDFGLKLRKQFEIAFHGAVAFRLFGRVVFRKNSPLTSECQTYITLTTPLPKKLPATITLCVISVFEKNGLELIFSDPTRRANYVHVGLTKIQMPGIPSVSFGDLESYLMRFPDSTVVNWPAHELSTIEFNLLVETSLKVPVLLAGTPFVITDRETYGQPFTRYIQEGSPFIYYGPHNHPMKNFFDTYPATLKIPINHHFLKNDTGMELSCPALDGMYNRFLLTTLFYQNKGLTLSVVAGPLPSVPLATIALLSSHLSNTL